MSINKFCLDEQTGYTGYSLDALNSNAIYVLDKYIIENTGLSVYARCWTTHNAKTIREFYCNSKMPDKMRELVDELFVDSPVLITLWKGNNVYEKLNKIKGKSHPRIAHETSIRGTFLCDNSICNLIHTPDSVEEAERELACLNNFSFNNFSLINNHVHKNTGVFFLNHSGIVMLHKALLRLEFNENLQLIIDYKDILKERSIRFFNETRKIIFKLNNSDNAYIDRIINIYFNEDIREMENILSDGSFPLSKWEKFVLLCGMSCIDKWEN